MKLSKKITLGTLGTAVAIIAGLFTIIEKTPSVIQVISSMSKAEASVVPDSAKIVRGFAGNANIKEINVQQPKGAK